MPAGDISDALQVEVLAHQFDSGRYGTQIYKWFTKAQQIIIRRMKIRTSEETETLVTVAGTSTVNLPSDFVREISLSLIDDNGTRRAPLTQFTLQTYDQNYDTTSRGSPYAYAVSEAQLLLLPVPDAVYSLYLRYFDMPGDITTSFDPVVPTEWHELLIDYALFRAYAREHDRVNAMFHKNLFDEALDKMAGEINSDHEADGPVVVQGTWANTAPSYGPRIP